MQSKKNVHGTNSEQKEIRTQIKDLEQRKEINIQSEQNEETSKINEDRLKEPPG